LHALLAPHIPALEIVGVDISPSALTLSNKNLEHNITHGHLLPRARKQVRFCYGDVLAGKLDLDVKGEVGGKTGWDIVISNPPYISPEGYERETERSVRLWEPRLALVPPPLGGKWKEGDKGDTFYNALLSFAHDVSARILLMEVAGTAQAGRVVDMAIAATRNGDKSWEGIEVWHDELYGMNMSAENSMERRGARDGNKDGKKNIRVRHVGTGHARAIMCFRGEGGGHWLSRSSSNGWLQMS